MAKKQAGHFDFAASSEGFRVPLFLDALEREAHAELLTAGYPTDCEQLRQRIVKEKQALIRAAESEADELNGPWAKLYMHLFLLDAIGCVRQLIADRASPHLIAQGMYQVGLRDSLRSDNDLLQVEGARQRLRNVEKAKQAVAARRRKVKAKAARRAFDKALDAGVSPKQAYQLVARQYKRDPRTIRRWISQK